MKKFFFTSISLFIIILLSTSGCTSSPWMPSKTRDNLQKYVDVADNVDIIFTEKGISINGKKQQTFQILNSVALGDIPKEQSCKQVATAYINSKGEPLAQIGAFIDGDCAYYVFYEDDIPTHANWMTQEGVDFFNTFLTRINTIKK